MFRQYEPKSDLPCGRAQPTPSTHGTETRIAGRGGLRWDDEAGGLSAPDVVIHDLESHAINANSAGSMASFIEKDSTTPSKPSM